MTPTASDLRTRVTRTTAIGVVASSLGAIWLAGAAGALGVLAGGALTTANFWLIARLAGAWREAGGRRGATLWTVLAAGRFLVLLVAFAAVCATGYAHPVAIVVGLTVLPCVLIAQSLRAVREAC